MTKKIFIASIFILLLTMPVLANTSPIISSSELIEKIDEYNGKTVVFQGEAIGEKMPRDNGVWINISDAPSSAIGIWFAFEDAEKIRTLGNYDFTGDIVKIEGVFHKACKEHKGEIDIHAASVEVVEQGSPVTHPVSTEEIWPAIILSLTAVVLGIKIRKSSKSKVVG